MLNLSKMKC